MPRKPTIKDVAAHAGVSKSTVSLVLQKSELIKPTTRTRVEQSIEALGYVKNRAAAALRGSETGLIGLVINDLRNPFFTEFATSTQMALMKHGYACVVANTNEDPVVQEQVIASMLEHEVSGLMWCPTYADNKDSFELVSRFDVPVLQVLRKTPDDGRSLPFFSLDYERGSELAVAHLVEQGIRNIAFIGGIEGQAFTQQRTRGYVDYMNTQGRSPQFYYGRPTRKLGYEMAMKLLRDAPEIRAVVCFNDLVALGFMSALAKEGCNIGPDFQVVGFDDIEECCQVYPQLTSVHCDIAALGRNTAQMIVQSLLDKVPPSPLEIMPVHLVARASSSLASPSSQSGRSSGMNPQGELRC